MTSSAIQASEAAGRMMGVESKEAVHCGSRTRCLSANELRQSPAATCRGNDVKLKPSCQRCSRTAPSLQHLVLSCCASTSISYASASVYLRRQNAKATLRMVDATICNKPTEFACLAANRLVRLLADLTGDRAFCFLVIFPDKLWLAIKVQ